MEKIYLTPANHASSELLEKRSRFIGDIEHIQNEDEAIEFVKTIKKKYYDAKHCAYAYITNNVKRYSDDGEPAKTAGVPILEILETSGLTDCVCVVTRYFGGILLGTGGLVRAYGQCAKLALENAGIKKLLLNDIYEINVPYSVFDNFKYISKQCDCQILECSYTDTVTLKCACKCEDSEKFIKTINDAFATMITTRKTDTLYL